MKTTKTFSSIVRPFALVLVVALTAVVAVPARALTDDKPDYDALARQVRKAYRNADFKKALELSEKMHELRPDELDPIYNVACMHCELGHKDKAYEWLDKAIDAGYADADHMADDYDLRTIRGERRFRRLLDRIRTNTSTKKSNDARPRDKKSEKVAADKPSLSPMEIRMKVGELTQKLMEAAGAGRNKEALRYAEQAVKLADVGLTNYNLACMHSLLGHKDKAFKFLTVAVDKGMGQADMVDQIKGDSDFDNIRKDARYKKVLARAGNKQQSASDEPAEKDVAAKWKVTLPQHFDETRKAPLIVALHHYHGNMKETTERWKAAASEIGAILLTPQGTRDMGGGQFHWGRNLNKIEDNIMDAIDDVMDEHKIDRKRIVLGGFSQGGWVTWALALRNPGLFAGIIPVAGRFSPESESVFKDEDLGKMKVFIMVGENDRDSLIKANRTAARRLRKIGAKTKLNVYEGIGHGFPEHSTRELVKALRFILKDSD